MKQSRDQWIKERREKFTCPHCGEVVGCSDDGMIGIFSAKILLKHAESCADDISS